MDIVEARPAEWSLVQKLAFRLFSIFFIVYILLNPNGGIPLPFFHKLFRLYIHVFERMSTWVSIHIFSLPQPLNTEGYGSGDTTLQYLFVLITWVVAMAGCLIWSIADNKRRNYNRVLYWVLVCVRYYLATTMLTYGFAKLFKTQFPYPSYYRLNQTYGSSSPMGLAWTFFGYSAWYNYFMGFAEVLGGALLYFRRTTMLGALITLSVSANIMAVNYSFDVPVKILSTILVAMCLFVLARDIKRLINFFILNKATPAANISAYIFKHRWQNITLIVVKYLIILQVLAGNIENSLEMQKIVSSMSIEQNLYGTFKVTSDGLITTDKGNSAKWHQIVIGADSITVTLSSNTILKFSYNLDRDKKQLVLYDKQTEPAYILNFTQLKSNLTLSGLQNKNKLIIKLKKTSDDTTPLMTRGFHWINEYPNNK